MRRSAGAVLVAACALYATTSGCRSSPPRPFATDDPDGLGSAVHVGSRPADAAPHASTPRPFPDPVEPTPPGDPWEAPIEGHGLDGRAIARVRAAHEAQLRRTCWTAAFAARAAAGHSTPRLRAVLTIAPSGDVTNVVILGDAADYPRLGDCVASRIKAWKFPKGSGSVTASMIFNPYGPP